jgi:FixJ family two-component response regulator
MLCIGSGGLALDNPNVEIALIDDGPSICTSVKRLLTLNGFVVTTYASPESFLSSNHTNVYNCLVLDIQFEGMSGLELREFLLRSGCLVPIIFISAEDKHQIARLPSECAFLHKPFSGSLLIETILGVLKPARHAS